MKHVVQLELQSHTCFASSAHAAARGLILDYFCASYHLRRLVG